MSTDASTSTAIAEHEAGRLDRAEAIYRTRIGENPNDVAALIGLGDVLSDSHQPVEAEEMYRRALVIDADSPAVAGAYDGIAAILQDSGDLDNAIVASKKAAVLRGDADDSFGVGNTLEFLGRIPDAIEMFVLAAKQRPEHSQAHTKAAQHLLTSGKATEAIPHYLAAIEANPSGAELHCNLASARRQTGDTNGALDSARTAIELNARLPEAHNVMGALWKDRRRLSDAAESFKRALAIKPDYADAMHNLGSVLESAGQVHKAGEMYKRSMEIQPEVPQFHQNFGMNLLLLGQFEQGWGEYEWRRLKPNNPGSRPFSEPAWDGSPLGGKTIVLFAEQGFGDTIQFLRYVPMVLERGGKVVLECQAPLAEVVKRFPGVSEVVVQGGRWPDRQVQLPLMSLPCLLGTRLESIPANVPYIFPEKDKVAVWREKLKGCTGRKIGLAWAGSPTHANDKARSMPPAKLSPLAEVPGVSFISLQKGNTGKVPEGLKLLDLTEDLNDFSDTAALIANLDLVITVDTSVAHLAGAMGKPVWILLAEVPDWRWLLGRSDSPWYPSAKLFRQSSAQSWGEVVATVVAELRKL